MSSSPRLSLAVLISVVTSLAAGPARAGAIIHVDQAALGAANGSSWTDAFPDLKDALAIAQPGNEIRVAGELQLEATLPGPLPSGLDVWFQFLVSDASVQPPITLSNAQRATTP